MPTIRGNRTELPVPPAPEQRRVFLSRGTDLQYRAKRLTDGKVIAEGSIKGEVKHAVESLGYVIC